MKIFLSYILIVFINTFCVAQNCEMASFQNDQIQQYSNHESFRAGGYVGKFTLDLEHETLDGSLYLRPTGTLEWERTYGDREQTWGLELKTPMGDIAAFGQGIIRSQGDTPELNGLFTVKLILDILSGTGSFSRLVGQIAVTAQLNARYPQGDIPAFKILTSNMMLCHLNTEGERLKQ